MKTLHKILFITVAAMFLATQSKAVLYWGRPYDPNLQRWIQRDPIGEQGGINLYEYVQNNPINYVDPFGLDAEVDILVAMGQGNTELVTELLEVGEGLSDEQMAAGRQWLQRQAAKKAAECERAKELKRVRDAEDAINKLKDIEKAQSKDPLKINRITKSEQNAKKEYRDIMNDHNNPNP